MRRSLTGACLAALLVAVATGSSHGDDARAAEVGRRSPAGGLDAALRALLARVDREALRDHQFALQQIADRHGGTRVAGTTGFDASATYVAERMAAAGYAVTLQEFTFDAWLPQGPSVVEQVAPDAVVYAEGADFALMTNSAPGDVTALVQAVDLRLGNPAASTSGCEIADFAGLTPGTIALLQRGACSFRQKAENAAAAGAAAVVVFNQGTAGRLGVFKGSVTRGYTGNIPVFATSYGQGVTWARLPGLRLRLVADVLVGPRSTVNVIADTPHGADDRVVLAGAHLDSVLDGPGLQDNGSGTAALLAIAAALADLPDRSLRHAVRFAWWGAEEAGLVGSYRYVNTLSQEALERLALYVNLDMIGSSNYVRFVLDGDGSTFGSAGAPGSAAIEAVFAEFFVGRGLPYEPARLTFRSDYAAFHYAGVPVGGLFTGAEGIKSTQQAIVFGGTPGEAYDPCYHAACDDLANVALDVLEQNADAAAYTLYRFATDPALPAAAKSRRRPGAPPDEGGCQAHVTAEE